MHTVAVGPDFFENLVLGEAFIDADARFVDVEHEDTLATLNQLVGLPFLKPFGLDRFDCGVSMSRDRRLTRALALELFGLAAGAAIGLRYTSVHAAGVECWALWDAAGPLLRQRSLAPVDLDQPRTARSRRHASHHAPRATGSGSNAWPSRALVIPRHRARERRTCPLREQEMISLFAPPLMAHRAGAV